MLKFINTALNWAMISFVESAEVAHEESAHITLDGLAKILANARVH